MSLAGTACEVFRSGCEFCESWSTHVINYIENFLQIDKNTIDTFSVIFFVYLKLPHQLKFIYHNRDMIPYATQISMSLRYIKLYLDILAENLTSQGELLKYEKKILLIRELNNNHSPCMILQRAITRLQSISFHE